MDQTIQYMSARAKAYGREREFGLCIHVIVREREKEARAYAQRAYASRLKIFGKDHPLTQESENQVNWLAKKAARE